VTQVQTVLGPVSVESLGFTLMHEHIVLSDPEIEINRFSQWTDEQGIPAVTDQLRQAKAAGVDSVVDLTAIGMGRNVARIRRIAEASGVHVIVATGIYTFDKLPRYFGLRGPGTRNGGPELLETLFVREIEEGIADTGIRAGIIKVTTDVLGITPDIERILRAAAVAHRRTGAPISTHTHAATFRGRDQQQLFRSMGVDLGRVIIGHCGDSTDLAYLTELMDAGSYIGMDRFGSEAVLPADQRVETLLALIARGYSARMVLSHDANCFTDHFEPEIQREQWPNCSYRYIPEQIIPRLRSAGVPEAEITQMTVQNPRQLFSRRDSY
jgi:phosphotriesterase-related protein